MLRASVFAAFRLMTSSNFVGYSIAKSAGLAPLRNPVSILCSRSYIPAMLGHRPIILLRAS
jgi:hypothetical protein